MTIPAKAASHTVTVTNGSVDGLAVGNIDYATHTLSQLVLDGSTGTAAPPFIRNFGKVFLNSTVTYATSTIINSNGSDMMQVGDASNSMQGIQGTLNVASSVPDGLALNLNDQAIATIGHANEFLHLHSARG